MNYKRKFPDVKIIYKDGKEYNLRRARVLNGCVYEPALVTAFLWIIEQKHVLSRKTEYGRYTEDKTLFIDKDKVERIEQKEINGEVTVYV
ncbi:hypothetical protein NVP1121O_008 [Vibrio phage 1.121.O._10N.286.46.C4]|nr:hypothetical protein NVP1121O_008 [Vibrio phage 1.121.O._10N.286.46.C4]